MTVKSTRQYSERDLKALWGLSAGRCANPACRCNCILAGTLADSSVIIGKIAHIYAHSNNGPRANSSLGLRERDSYRNLILLCANCHDLIDGQPNTYTPAILMNWKIVHEQWVQDTLSQRIIAVTFAELETVARAISSQPSPSTLDFNVIDPREKMRRNGLTQQVEFLLTLGLGKAAEVKDFVAYMSYRDSSFPERLKTGFVDEYERLRGSGYHGDNLFEALRIFACGGSQNFGLQAAGLAVLGYLFSTCEVFEK